MREKERKMLDFFCRSISQHDEWKRPSSSSRSIVTHIYTQLCVISIEKLDRIEHTFHFISFYFIGCNHATQKNTLFDRNYRVLFLFCCFFFSFIVNAHAPTVSAYKVSFNITMNTRILLNHDLHALKQTLQ